MRKIEDPLNLTSKPLAAAGYDSYRCKSAFGWIMIGAINDNDAFNEALRSSKYAKRENLQKWDGKSYIPCFEVEFEGVHEASQERIEREKE